MPTESLPYPSDASESQYHTDSKNSPEQYPPDVSSKQSSQHNKSSNLSFDEAHHSPNHNVVSEKLGHGSESKSDSLGYKALPPPPYTPLDFMTRPVIPGCPTGLEYLVTVDQLLISRSVQRYKEHINMFQVKNSLGQPIYFAQEETNPREQQCCPKKRGFKMHLTDNYGNEVIRAVRDFRCCAGCCWCACLDCGAYEMTVQSPAGNDIGYVRQACSWMTNDFEVLDADRQHVLTIKGPAICLRPMPGMNVESQVQSLEGSTLGSITRLAFGPFRDARPYSDELSVTFPLDMDVHMKACLLTAAFFLNLIFFERFVYIQ